MFNVKRVFKSNSDDFADNKFRNGTTVNEGALVNCRDYDLFIRTAGGALEVIDLFERKGASSDVDSLLSHLIKKDAMNNSKIKNVVLL